MGSFPLSPAGVWKMDTNHTQLSFSIRHLGICTVHGLFGDHSGQADIGPDLESSSVEMTARTDSFNTGNTWRDDHIRGPEFLDCAQFPELHFRSTAVVEAGDRYTLAGELTIKGVTNPVSFDLTFYGTSVFPVDETTHAGFLATTTIRRTDFNAGYGVPIAADEVDIRVDAELVAPDEGTPP